MIFYLESWLLVYFSVPQEWLRQLVIRSRRAKSRKRINFNFKSPNSSFLSMIFFLITADTFIAQKIHPDLNEISCKLKWRRGKILTVSLFRRGHHKARRPHMAVNLCIDQSSGKLYEKFLPKKISKQQSQSSLEASSCTCTANHCAKC